MIFAVTTFDDQQGIRLQSLLEIAGRKTSIKSFNLYAPRFFLLQYEGTARSLAEILGMTSEQNVTGLITRLPETYHGYASPEMWEWISLMRGTDDD